MSDTKVDSPERTNATLPVTFWTFIGLFVGGAALGLVGAFLQAAEVTVGSVSIPLWAIVVLAAMLATTRAITINYGSRKPAVAWFLGWLLVSLLLSLRLPGGDQVVSDGLVQVFYFFGGVVLGSAFVSIPAQLRAIPEAAPPAEISHDSVADHVDETPNESSDRD